MEATDEKSDTALSEATAGIQQLRLDIEQNALVLAQYEKAFSNDSTVAQSEDQHQLRQILLFVANAPANVLRRLSKRLQRLTRKLLLTMHHATWRFPRFLVGDSIRFEDALGRRCKLPYHYFKHWALLKPYLAYTFHGLPGDYQVQRGQYRLSVGKRGRISDAKQWNNLIRPGEHVRMSVMCNLLLEVMKKPRCPACNRKSFENGFSAGQTICQHCNSTFEISEPSLHQHVKASDGGSTLMAMLNQKKSKSIRGTLASSTTNQDAGYLDDQAEVDNEFMNSPEPSRSNVGVAQLQHITIRPTKNPLEIIDALEGYLDQFITLSQDPNAGEDRNIRRFRNALLILWHEASRNNELNYLDFSQEHNYFLSHSCWLMKAMQNWLCQNKSIFDTSQVMSQMTNFSRWVFEHYPIIITDQNGSLKDSVLVLIKTLTGKVVCFRCLPSTTIAQLKNALKLREGMPISQQYLVSKGRKLEDEYTVSHYKLGPEYYVHLLLPIWRVTGEVRGL